MAELILTVYSRNHCHLCDDLITALRGLQGRFSFAIDVVDVDSDNALEQRYGEWVPVLKHGDHELCHYFLDEHKVSEYLSAALSKMR